MNHTITKESSKEIKWHNKTLLIRSTLIGLMLFAIFWGLAKRAEPPEGYVFERLPSISGIYRCCEAGGRYSQSWVGPQGVNCRGFSYYHLGTGRNDCGFKEQLDGVLVTVEQVLVPAYDGPLPLVSRIDVRGETYYEVGDKRIREIWIEGSQTNAFTLAFIFAVIFHGAQLIFIDHQTRKSKGNTK